MTGNEDYAGIVGGLEGETKSINARKRKVKKAISSLGMNVGENCDPPVIAVLGSGGGLRAMIGFLGTISKLVELKLLGAVTYMAGISGSTWCMSSLYSKQYWSDFSHMEQLEIQLRQRMKKQNKRQGSWKKIKEKFLGDSYSLTDVWAYTFVFRALNSINEGTLSSHKEVCENGDVPYPIYSAVRKDKIHESKLEAWFEFTPHKSGFPAYESYIKTELLGCRFQGGRVLEKQPEHDLIYLQGLWGSAPADWVWSVSHELYRRLIRLLTAVKKRIVSFFKRAWNWISRKERDKPKKMFSPISLQMNLEKIKVPQIRKSWSEYLRDVYENAIAIKNLTFCLVQWKWGTINNFLYKCQDKIPEGSKLFDKKQIHLVDAGLEINTPYPLVLPPHRKVDLILSFDFSSGDPFETVKETAKYCEDHQVPFPKITGKSYEEPATKKCYIFKGDGNRTPDVMHFPLFNIENCGDAKKIKNLSKKYNTCVCSYSEYMMEELLGIAKKNVESSKDDIRKQIKECVKRSNMRGMSQT
ncbi:cytosolic phospholipase A2 gamma-like [Lithobates pipiens]